jgi:hypothetical protein
LLSLRAWPAPSSSMPAWCLGRWRRLEDGVSNEGHEIQTYWSRVVGVWTNLNEFFAAAT